MGKERQFVVNERGEKVAVLIGIEEYGKLLEELEDLEDIRAYDEAMASGETPVPFEEAIERIERERKGK
jgi:PHD/YefM family antitoxin component YafN of YafNO toxin-antitoxin module